MTQVGIKPRSPTYIWHALYQVSHPKTVHHKWLWSWTILQRKDTIKEALFLLIISHLLCVVPLDSSSIALLLCIRRCICKALPLFKVPVSRSSQVQERWDVLSLRNFFFSLSSFIFPAGDESRRWQDFKVFIVLYIIIKPVMSSVFLWGSHVILTGLTPTSCTPVGFIESYSAFKALCCIVKNCIVWGLFFVRHFWKFLILVQHCYKCCTAAVMRTTALSSSNRSLNLLLCG